MAAPGELRMKAPVSAQSPGQQGEQQQNDFSADHTDGGSVGDISSTDVFEIAAELSSECAKLGNQYGHETVAKIVPYVVRLLEELEYSVDRSELLTADLVEAQHEASVARDERNLEVAFRRKLEQEYQQAISEWEEKHSTMEAKLNSLQQTKNESSAGVTGRIAASFSRSPSEKQIMADLTGALAKVEHLQQDLHTKNMEEAKQTSEVEALMQQLKRLASVNQALRRGQQTAKLRSQTLSEEKAALTRRCKDLQTQLEAQASQEGGQESPKEEGHKDENDGRAMPATADAADVTSEAVTDRSKQLRYSREDMEKILQERLEYKLRVEEVEEELSDLKESMGIEVDLRSFQVASPIATLPRKRKTSRLRGLFEHLDSAANDEGGGADVVPF
eukprot:scpid52482/ scgid29611/ RILP-like protein 1; Rab-interacting lysosomal-like protein 1